MHLGYSTTKPGYVFEILEGPRKGKVITSSQVKFRETVFPMRLSSDAPPPAKEEDAILWDDVVTLPERTLVRTAVPYHQEGHGTHMGRT